MDAPSDPENRPRTAPPKNPDWRLHSQSVVERDGFFRNEGSQSMQGMWITKDYFSLMGLKAVAGRGFEPSDFGLGPVKTIVLGYEFWQRTFNGDPQIIGKTVRISRWDVALQ
jgi:MacB-like periplasmic core domain